MIPLVRDGHRVVGMDLSMPMLRRLRQRIDRLSPRARARAMVLRSDFRRYALGRRFPLIVCPFNAMQHLYTRADVERFLGCVKDHLSDGGTLAFDVQSPDLKWLSRDPEKRWSRTRFKDPRDGRTYYYSTNHSYDPETQINWIRIFYDASDPGLDGRATTGADLSLGARGTRGAGKISRPRGRVIHLAQRQFFPEELRALLEYNGFTVDKREGGFGGEPFDGSSDSHVCRCSIRRGPRR